jgi:DNA invertase Pin-like site-specific DNA recombinase
MSPINIDHSNDHEIENIIDIMNVSNTNMSNTNMSNTHMLNTRSAKFAKLAKLAKLAKSATSTKSTIQTHNDSKKRKLSDIDFDNIASQFASQITNSNSNTNIDNYKISNEFNSAIIYCRCSTPSQNTSIGHHSLSTQISICIYYCAKNNLNVDKIQKDICGGHDISKLAICDIPSKYSNINLIIADPSRLSRKVSDADKFILDCLKSNIRVHFVRDKIVVNTYSDYKKAIGLVCDAYIETQTLSKRIKSSYEIKKHLGSHIGKIPYGFESYYIIDPVSQYKIIKLKEISDEQNVIGLINKMYFGSDIGSFNKLFRKIMGSKISKKFKLTDATGEDFTDIYYGNLTQSAIAEFLNKHDIKYRTKIWKTSNVSAILDKTEDYDVKYYKTKKTHYNM